VPSSRNKPARFTRRDALRAGLGLGAAAGFASGCGPYTNRCAGGPQEPPGASADAGAVTDPRALLRSIETIVVVMMENRSFDNWLGGLRLDAAYPAAATVDALRGNESNPDGHGGVVTVAGMAGNGTLNPKHDWTSSRAAFAGGTNSGFVNVNAGPIQSEVMGFHDRERLPFSYALADQFVVCDRWFSSVMGPTWPNRFYLHAATAAGHTSNVPMGLAAPPTIWERLADRCWTAKNYYGGSIPWYSVAFPTKSFSGNDAMTPDPLDRFYSDAARGELPHFALIDPDFELTDGHPPHDLALAEAFLSSVYRALAASPQWPRTLFVVVFDEHGGFYDHVPPPTTDDADPDFRQLGFRVPAIVAGPLVRRGAVVSTPFDHVSIAATLATRFGIASLGRRMDAAVDLSSCLDPDRVRADDATTTSAASAPATPLLPGVNLVTTQSLRSPWRASSQPEIVRLAAAGGVPVAHVDTRPPAERLRAWLRHAQELEAVRVID
jgi:phospholipase C